MFQVTLSGEISGQLIDNNLSIWMEAKSGVLETERGHQKERREVTNTATAGTVFPEACLGLPAFSPSLPTIACDPAPKNRNGLLVCSSQALS